MVTLEIPHVNIMTKVDLLSKKDQKELYKFLEPDANLLNETLNQTSRYNKKFAKLNKCLAKVIEDFSLVKFHPLDITDEDSINDSLIIVDNVCQFYLNSGLCHGLLCL
jgi:hypothetical protein